MSLSDIDTKLVVALLLAGVTNVRPCGTKVNAGGVPNRHRLGGGSRIARRV